MFSLKNESEQLLDKLQLDIQRIKNNIDSDFYPTTTSFQNERVTFFDELDCYMPLSPFSQIDRELVEYWNQKKKVKATYLQLYTCPICTYVDLDEETNKENWKQCDICEQRVCDINECTMVYCKDCNPEDPRVFRPCSWTCQRHRPQYSENINSITYWTEGLVCAHCHAAYLKSRELEELRRVGFDAHRFSVCKGNMNEKSIRNFAYIGRDKIKFFVKYRGLNEVVEAAEKKHHLIENRDRSLDARLPALIRSVLDWSMPVDILIRHKMEDLMDVKTPPIRPWKMIRILARLAIIFRRYREDFYKPNTGGYVKVGAQSFNLKRKLRD